MRRFPTNGPLQPGGDRGHRGCVARALPCDEWVSTGPFVEATGLRSHEGGDVCLDELRWKQDELKMAGARSRDNLSQHAFVIPWLGVSWGDAAAYSEWLGSETGKPYRLPSEAEWEYACRAGTTTRYPSATGSREQEANFGGKVGKTTEVGAYPPNPWGLYGMHGNVSRMAGGRLARQLRGRSGRWLGVDGWRRKEFLSLPVIRGGSWNADPGDLPFRHPQRDRARHPQRHAGVPRCPERLIRTSVFTALPLGGLQRGLAPFARRRRGPVRARTSLGVRSFRILSGADCGSG